MTKGLLSSEWGARLGDFTQLIVGFSGGLDSTVLLHVLASHSSLRTKLVAVHINHGLSENALYWQSHCEGFCLNLGIDFFAQSVQLDRFSNIEEQARTARYAVFSSLLNDQGCLILAHHRDDQAETLLLQLFRGAGVDGLAAMTELGTLGFGALARPFLSCARKQLEHYAAIHELTWVEDESNQNVRYSRNYLRQKIMPLLVEQWPGVVGTIARTATHCQQARSNLDELARNDCQELLLPTASLCINHLKSLDFIRVTNVLRVWLKKNQVQLPSTRTFQRLIDEVIEASSNASPIVAWGKVQVRRYRDCIFLNTKHKIDLPSCTDWAEFPHPLVLANTLIVSARKAQQGLMLPQGATVQVRFRQGGELLCWHGQTKQLKKLLQEWEVPPWLRGSIPLIYIHDQLAAVVGYAVSDLFFSKNQPSCWELGVATICITDPIRQSFE